MKTTHVEVYSLKELSELGYKARENGQGWYLGNSRWPTQTIKADMEKFLGNKYQLRGLDNGNVLVESDEGHHYYLKPHLIKTKIKKIKAQKIIYQDDVVTYHGYGFDFPCSMRRMGEDDAIMMAKWILKVTGA